MAILLIENIAGKPFDGCPLKINEVNFQGVSKGTLNLQRFIGQRIRSIEVNGARQTFHPELAIQKYTQLRVRPLVNGALSFHDETTTLID